MVHHERAFQRVTGGIQHFTHNTLQRLHNFPNIISRSVDHLHQRGIQGLAHDSISLVKHFKHSMHDAKDRLSEISPDGYVINLGLAAGGYGIWALQSVINAESANVLQTVPSKELGLLTITALIISQLGTTAINYITAKKEGLVTADLHTTIFNIITNNPSKAVKLGTLWRMSYLLLNPNNLMSLLSGGDRGLAISVLDQEIIEFLYLNSFNALIYTGHTKWIANIIRFVEEQAKETYRSLDEMDPNQAFTLMVSQTR